jgi:hypothetical protein
MHLKFLELNKIIIILKLKVFIAHFIQLAIIYIVTKQKLQFDRGMDLSDESLYLIAANPSNRYDTWGWPFGWVTSVIFEISNNEVTQFRNLGLMLMIGSSYYFAWNFSKIIEKKGMSERASFYRTLLICFVISTSSLLIYNGFIRTPGYNWLNLVSILFALGSFFKLTYLIKPGNRYSIYWHTFFLALALFFSFHSKPTTPLILLIGFIIIWKKIFDIKQTIELVFVLSLSSLVIIFSALLLEIWPPDFMQRFLEIISRPPLNDRATIQFGLLQLIVTPFYAGYFVLRNIQIQTVLLLIGFILMLAITRQKKLRQKTTLSFTAAYSIIIVLSFMGLELNNNGISFNPLKLNDTSYLSLSWLGLYFVVFLPYLKQWKDRDKNFSKFRQVNLLLVLSLIAFGFGSSTAFLGKISGASMFIVCLLFSAIDNLASSTKLKFFHYIWVLTLNLALILIVFVASTKNPYRIAPINQQIQKCSPESFILKIKFDTELCAELSLIREALTKNGFSNQSTLLNLSDPWQPGIEVLLGTEVPPTIMLTIPGYKGSNKLLTYNLQELSKVRDLTKDWIILPSKNQDNPITYENLVSSLELGIQTNLVVNYEVIYENKKIQIWKPTVRIEN